MHTTGGKGFMATKTTMASDLLRVGLATGMILLAPLIAMQITREVVWTGFDFAIAAALLAGAGLACVRTARRVAGLRPWQRRAVVGALALVFTAVWVELAVGVFFDLGS